MSIPEITVDDLAPLLASGARVIDVREPAEYQEVHAVGAVLVPLGTVPDNVDAFRGDGTTYIICRSGARSLRACEFLQPMGIDVVNVAGGTLAWVAADLPVAAGDLPS
jgi:rhodanese-related sulfurtransferase